MFLPWIIGEGENHELTDSKCLIVYSLCQIVIIIIIIQSCIWNVYT